MKRKTIERLSVICELAAIATAFAVGCCIGSSEKDFEKAERIRYDYVDVAVNYGDKLWTICKQYCPSGMDIRDYIQDVETLNGIEASIYPGQKIKVICYETSDE